MSKRLNSNYPLEPKDLYPTPFKAVQPLIPHLDGIRRFAEVRVKAIWSDIWNLSACVVPSGATSPPARNIGRHRQRSDHHESAVLPQIATFAAPDDSALPANRSERISRDTAVTDPGRK